MRAVNSNPRLLLILLACACLCGCTDVQERSHIVGGHTGTPLTASVGDTVLRVSREKNLPNITGKADIFGRTTPTGVETVQYLGVKDGRAFFKRRTVNVETGATTMNSTPALHPQHSHDNHQRVCQCLRSERLRARFLFWNIDNSWAAHGDSSTSSNTRRDGRREPASVGRFIAETSTTLRGW
jgi:hypothetical protein